MEKLMKILEEIRPDIDFSAGAMLIDDGILDSFDIVSLVAEINDVFNIDIGVEDLVPENFNTPSAMMTLIERLGN